MDSLKTLIERKQFQLVVDLTCEYRDAASAAFRIAALVGLGRLEEALGLITKFRGEFEDANFSIMRVHFEILLLKNRYDRAYEELNYYKELPYISQEVEEYLNQAEEMIRSHERSYNKNRKRSKDEIYEILEKEKDSLLLLAVLNEIRDYNIRDFTYHLILFLKRGGINSFVSTYALLLLVSSGYEKPIDFYKNDKKYVVTPKELTPPFINEKYDEVVKRIEITAKDPAVSEAAKSLLNDLVIILYPEDIFDCEIKLLAGSLLSIAFDHFQIPRDDLSFARLLDVDVTQLRLQTDHFAKCLNANPPVEDVK